MEISLEKIKKNKKRIPLAIISFIIMVSAFVYVMVNFDEAYANTVEKRLPNGCVESYKIYPNGTNVSLTESCNYTVIEKSQPIYPGADLDWTNLSKA